MLARVTAQAPRIEDGSSVFGLVAAPRASPMRKPWGFSGDDGGHCYAAAVAVRWVARSGNVLPWIDRW